jgi:hypothetical protein
MAAPRFDVQPVVARRNDGFEDWFLDFTQVQSAVVGK